MIKKKPIGRSDNKINEEIQKRSDDPAIKVTGGSIPLLFTKIKRKAT